MKNADLKIKALEIAITLYSKHNKPDKVRDRAKEIYQWFIEM